MNAPVNDPSSAARSAWDIAAAVPDPELPVVTIGDLGILRDVTENDTGCVHVQITPTYSGCPAVETIREDLVEELSCAGYRRVDVEVVLWPAWTTDWITAEGHARLAANGIAPPAPVRFTGGPVDVRIAVRCPRCGSPDTRELSRFGATACKALRVCGDCAEPFDHVKPI
ncbi:phenylacetate-CoA oxygenase subunit PaaJ [Nocardioides sp. zg-579]|uniref:Phenylacetate-CoA oxygenase subunit PaaJ n=1 Tax=Nocardioides marmotae TaxID=2663857 RepID=A0A6I3JBS8_9ACTN|nr:1,2-phenylacetyl-CoA epoxidase subunit PaaD [Nocardioides marmotae]MCR6031858.1 phenylacetate-CoA oxygenase subunit PaaJ [Gordonia jinghuaiqii]MTB95499.1 phenylacetate-CoA oxygenase subunit PaaJ [Nocardioides marmotae]QKE00930.1 phenylacetate-CoA oxygenase subunit PaaJ [Nocardioides marmotae]